MALFNNNMFSGGGILEGLFPEMEMGQGNRGGFLSQELESLLAQEARDRAAQAFRLRSRTSKIDPSLMPDYQPPNKELENFLNPAPPQGWMVQPSQPSQAPQPQPMTPPWGAGATPFQFAGMSGGNVPMTPQFPQPQRDLASNGLDRNMTSLPPEYAAMDATQNPLAGYVPSPSVVDQIPANARPAGPAQQAAVPIPSSDIGFGDRLTSAFQGFTNAKSPMQALGNLFGGLTTGQRTDPAGIAQQNTKQAFQGFQQLFLSRGLPMAQANSLAMIAATNPKVAEEILKAPTTGEAAIFNPYLGPGGGSEGVGGTNNNSPQDRLSAFNMRKKADEEQGQALGKARATYFKDEITAKEAVAAVDRLLANPNLPSIVGLVGGRIPKEIMTEGQRGALAQHDQILGKAFMDAYAMLKGGGQITEIEGKKATEAKIRMDRAVSEKEYRAAMIEFKEAVKEGAHKLAEYTGNPAPWGKGNLSSSTPPPPKGFIPLNR